MDDEALPTYEAATRQDPLRLIAPYVRQQDLRAAARVDRRWRAAFARQLWERPHRLWDLSDGAVLS